MELIDKSALVAEIKRRIKINKECMLGLRNLDYYQGKVDALNDTLSFINTLEVKEVYEIPARIEVNKYHNRFISSWAGLCQYDNFRIGEEIKILLPKKAQKGEEV